MRERQALYGEFRAAWSLEKAQIAALPGLLGNHEVAVDVLEQAVGYSVLDCGIASDFAREKSQRLEKAHADEGECDAEPRLKAVEAFSRRCRAEEAGLRRRLVWYGTGFL